MFTRGLFFHAGDYHQIKQKKEDFGIKVKYI